MTCQRLLISFVVFVVLAGCGGSATDPPIILAHTVFRTPVSGSSSSRPAIQVEILDAREHIIFTAELYLAVQSSRFPNNTWVLLPLNVDEFAGCNTRFVQLPFEVHESDLLLINVLDNDELTSEHQRNIVNGCKATGYCVVVGSEVFCPEAALIVNATVPKAADILGRSIIQEFELHRFQNYGTAEYIVPRRLPATPQQANELSVRDDHNKVHVVLKVYGPEQSLEFDNY